MMEVALKVCSLAICQTFEILDKALEVLTDHADTTTTTAAAATAAEDKERKASSPPPPPPKVRVLRLTIRPPTSRGCSGMNSPPNSSSTISSPANRSSGICSPPHRIGTSFPRYPGASSGLLNGADATGITTRRRRIKFNIKSSRGGQQMILAPSASRRPPPSIRRNSLRTMLASPPALTTILEEEEEETVVLRTKSMPGGKVEKNKMMVRMAGDHNAATKSNACLDFAAASCSGLSDAAASCSGHSDVAAWRRPLQVSRSRA